MVNTLRGIIEEAYNENEKITVSLYHDDKKYKKHNESMLDVLSMFSDTDYGFEIEEDESRLCVNITIGEDGVKYLYESIKNM